MKSSFDGRFENSRSGFSLIEMLVVIFIIALIASVISVAVQNSRRQARDTRRLADLRQLKNALELEYDKSGDYPRSAPPGPPTWKDSCTNPTNYITRIINSGFVGFLPKDPINSGIYCIRYRGQGQDFKLAAYMESPANQYLSANDGGVQATWYEIFTKGAQSWW